MRFKKWFSALVCGLLLLSLVAGCSPGQPLPPIKFLSGDSEVAKKYAMGLQEIVRKGLGIELTLENVDFKTRLQKMRDGDFAIVMAGWAADYNDPMTFLDMWTTNSPYNDVKWSNKQYDDLIAKAKASSDQAERMNLMAQAEKILLEELPIIPIYWPQRNYAEHPWVKGIIRTAIGPGNDWKFAYTEGRPGGDDPQHLNLNLGEEPPDLQSITTTDTVSFDVLNACLEGLVRLGPDGQYKPGSGLAESWTVSEDGTKYTFKLKKGLKWSDGTPLTAHDFEYAWKKAVDPRTASQYNYMLFYIKGAEDVANIQLPDKEKEPAKYKEAEAAIQAAMDKMGVKAVDDLTLEVELVAKNNIFISLTAFPTYFPLNQKAHEKWGDKYATEKDKMLFCGPFVIDKWEHGSKMVLKKNPNYWDAKNVKLEYIQFDMIKDINTPISMYEANQLDAIGVPGDFIPKFQKERPQEFHQMAEAVAWYLECNLNHPVLKDPKFRKALSMAIDRQAYCDNVLRNYSKPATGLTPPSIAGKDATESFHDKYIGNILPATGNPQEAQKLLKESLKQLGYAMPKQK
ncbi:MAG TPA: hypothetical protein GXX30_05245 [Firmicutes bacterium]|nr:hypothetical protein [Candidatus Fermentithermobacillaceae bacterium]